MGAYVRLVYRESEGAVVVLDITDSSVVLKREDKWKTHGVFSKHEQTEMRVVSDEGVLVFGVDVETLKLEESSLFVKYHLLHDNQRIETHTFRYEWKKEEHS